MPFLHTRGSQRQKLILPKQTNCCLLWGTLPRQSCPSIRISPRRTVFPVKAVSKDVAPNTCVGLVHDMYRIPLVQESAETEQLLTLIQMQVSDQIIGLKTEHCLKIGVDGDELSSCKLDVLTMILGHPESKFRTESFLDQELKKYTNAVIIEIGPRLSPLTATAWSAKAMSIFRYWGLTEINRVELSRRYLLNFSPGCGLLPDRQNIVNKSVEMLHDQMTGCIYSRKPSFFQVVPEEVPVMEKGREALEEINENVGLGFDEEDLHCYTKLFRDDIRRNPTNVEVRDIALFNSEHKISILQKADPKCAETGRLREARIVMDFIISDALDDYRNKHLNCSVENMRSLEEKMRKTINNRLNDGGIGQIDLIDDIEKGDRMLVVRIGGPTDRIGLGGGSAAISSMIDREFDAGIAKELHRVLGLNNVQHGDAGMAEKLHRVVSSCVEMEEKNPIISLGDLAPGGSIYSNPLKDTIYPNGVSIVVKEIVVGDCTRMSLLEIWGRENQKQDAILVKPERRDLLQSICARESLQMAVIGSIGYRGRIVLVDALCGF